MTPHQHCVIARQRMANIANHKMVGRISGGHYFSVTGGRYGSAKGISAVISDRYCSWPAHAKLNTYTGGIIGGLLR